MPGLRLSIFLLDRDCREKSYCAVCGQTDAVLEKYQIVTRQPIHSIFHRSKKTIGNESAGSTGKHDFIIAEKKTLFPVGPALLHDFPEIPALPYIDFPGCPGVPTLYIECVRCIEVLGL